VSTTVQDYDAQVQSQGGVWYPPPWHLPVNATSPALASSIVAHTGTCRLYGFTATSTNVAAQFILVFDEIKLPGNGAIPKLAVNVAAASPAGAYWGSVGRWFNRGIILANSTTQGTLTLGAADTIFDVQYA
jgi:hypothetical protein